MTDIDPKQVGPSLEAEAFMDENLEITDTFAPLPEEATRRSKKRLREVSVEVPSPKDEKEVLAVECKAVDGPPKKNRLKAGENSDAEGDPPMPLTPPSTSAAPLSTSPPHDAKVRQIRRRVKDLSWKEGQPKANDQLATGDVDQPDDDSSKSISTKSDSEKEETVVSKDDPVVISSLAPVPQTEPTSRADTSVSSDSKDVEVSSNLKRAEVLDFAAGSVTGRLSPDPDACQGKRRREDEDLNPRDSKRITPPPDKDKENTEPAKATPKPSGFLAYASSTSPFASANGPSIFNGGTPKPTFGSPTIPAPTFSSASPAGPSTTTKLTPSFGSAFSKYSGSASPFVTTKPSGTFGVASGSKSPVRSKSPGRHVNAFEPYTKSSGKFSAATPRPPKKKQRKVSAAGSGDGYTGSGSASESADEEGEEEPERPTSFGDILSAKDTDTVNNEEKKIKLIEQEVVTGEEDEYTEFQVRSKLFELVSATSWEERGVGMLKLNINENTGRARLVLRTDGVLRLVLNAALFKGMDFSLGADPRYVKFGLVEDKKIVLYTLRFSTAKHAEDLLAHVRSHISELRSSSSPAPSSRV